MRGSGFKCPVSVSRIRYRILSPGFRYRWSPLFFFVVTVAGFPLCVSSIRIQCGHSGSLDSGHLTAANMAESLSPSAPSVAVSGAAFFVCLYIYRRLHQKGLPHNPKSHGVLLTTSSSAGRGARTHRFDRAGTGSPETRQNPPGTSRAFR
jgi:hypothetical protein